MSLCTSHGLVVNTPLKRNRENFIPVNALAKFLYYINSQGADQMNTQGEASIISIENETQHAFPFLAFSLFPSAPALVAAAAGETSAYPQI